MMQRCATDHTFLLLKARLDDRSWVSREAGEVSYNPWGKKNPYLSMWLSGANAVFGAMRSRAIGAAHRQTKAAIDEGTRQAIAFWGLGPRPRSTKRRRRR